MTRLTATYEIESPVGVQRAAEVMAGEQSTSGVAMQAKR